MITLHCSSNCLSSFHMHLQREGARLRCPSKADGSMRPLECACYSWSHGKSNSGGAEEVLESVYMRRKIAICQ